MAKRLSRIERDIERLKEKISEPFEKIQAEKFTSMENMQKLSEMYVWIKQ